MESGKDCFYNIEHFGGDTGGEGLIDICGFPENVDVNSLIMRLRYIENPDLEEEDKALARELEDYKPDNDSDYDPFEEDSYRFDLLMGNECEAEFDSGHIDDQLLESGYVSKDGFSIWNGVCLDYFGDDRVLCMPEGITEIADYVFAQTDIVQVILPGTLKRIGKGAFLDCKFLKSISFPSGINEIEEDTFRGSGIEKIYFSDTVHLIGKNAFRDCFNLRRIILPDHIISIGDGAFRNCTELREISLSRRTEEIGDCAFAFCRNLKLIKVPDVEKIAMGIDVFEGCNSLADENGLVIIQNHLFSYCPDKGKCEGTVSIPDYVKRIEMFAFNNSEAVHIEMPINCPFWPQVYHELFRCSYSLLQRSGSTISFRDADGKIVAHIVLVYEEEPDTVRLKVIHSIRSEDGVFDFKGYDECFSILTNNSNKISVASARMEYPYELSSEMRDRYESYLKEHA